MKKYIITAIILALLVGVTFGAIKLTNRSYEQSLETNRKSLTGSTTTAVQSTTDTTADTEKTETETKTVDLIVFAGQSNMAGNGKGARTPLVDPLIGVEFRAVTDPTKLYAIDETTLPFGCKENSDTDTDKINDVYYEGSLCKKGDLVPSFITEYHAVSGSRVVAVSASKFNASSTMWANPDEKLSSGLVERFNTAETWLTENGYTINNRAVVWLQGETDGDDQIDPETYISNVRTTFDYIKENSSIENFYIITIGKHYDKFTANAFEDYDPIYEAQKRLCEENEDIFLISEITQTLTYGGSEARYNKDGVHFNQTGLNEIGEDAGKNMASILYPAETTDNSQS